MIAHKASENESLFFALDILCILWLIAGDGEPFCEVETLSPYVLQTITLSTRQAFPEGTVTPRHFWTDFLNMSFSNYALTLDNKNDCPFLSFDCIYMRQEAHVYVSYDCVHEKKHTSSYLMTVSTYDKKHIF
jgi:hypothetical protein